MTAHYESVLLDALCTAYGHTRAEAEEALRYAANVKAVARILDAVTSQWSYPGRDVYCPACDAGDFMKHDEDCELVADLKLVIPARGG